MKREKNLQDLADRLSTELYSCTISYAHKKKICAKCRKPKGKFKDEMGQAGWETSALCQVCQDRFLE